MSIEQDLKNRDLWANGFMVEGKPHWRVRVIDDKFLRYGEEVYVVCILEQPHHTSETTLCVNKNGVCVHDKTMRLIRRPVKHKWFLNIYSNSDFYATLFFTREEADERGGSDRLACIEVEFQEGEGLK